jgi:hypothetical protein
MSDNWYQSENNWYNAENNWYDAESDRNPFPARPSAPSAPSWSSQPYRSPFPPSSPSSPFPPSAPRPSAAPAPAHDSGVRPHRASRAAARNAALALWVVVGTGLLYGVWETAMKISGLFS